MAIKPCAGASDRQLATPLPAVPAVDTLANMSDRSSTARPRTIVLRPVQEADLPALFNQQLDPESNRMAVSNPRDEQAFAAHWTRIFADHETTARAIIADGVLAGTVSCFRMDGLPAVGYWIDREHWGRGIATRAVAALLSEVQTRPLHARAASTNRASIRVLERNGFVITGSRAAPADDRFPACIETLLLLER